LEKRSVPLTSASSGAKDFRLDGKANGAAVRIADINLKQAEGTVKQITDAGGNGKAFACDVTDQRQVREAFQELFAKERVEILVNNAGISHIGTVEGTTEADFEKIFRVNVKGVYNCMYACIGHMKGSGGGVILNMASIAGSAALADRFAYSMSKGAVVAMTYSVAKDYLRHNIRCNCISPARVHTPFVDDYLRKNYPGREKEMFEKLAKSQPIGRMGEPQEVASLALFLCSNEAAFITGVDYPLDGGFFNLRG
jgi:NAD(P)-dependent dehydrogenase (short-subunit alcohol dehydrogenase family)